jgi:serine/threonine protein kinase
VCAEVASILNYAHTCMAERGARLGIVHRDVNPARIYLGTEGEIILTDFARARSLLPGPSLPCLPIGPASLSACEPEAPP